MWMSGQSDILECVLLKRGNLSQKSLLKRVHISTSRFTHKDGRSRHRQQIVWAFSCIWALLLGLAGTERGAGVSSSTKVSDAKVQRDARFGENLFFGAVLTFSEHPQLLNGPSSAELLQCKHENMKDLFLPYLVWPFGNFVFCIAGFVPQQDAVQTPPTGRPAHSAGSELVTSLKPTEANSLSPHNSEERALCWHYNMNLTPSRSLVLH